MAKNEDAPRRKVRVRDILILLITGGIFALTLYLLLGMADVRRFIPADEGAVVRVDRFGTTVQKIFTSDIFRSLAAAGMTDERAGDVIRRLDELESSSIAWPFMQWLIPKFTLVLPTDVASYRSDQFPVIAIADIGRQGLLFSMLAGSVAEAGGTRLIDEYRGHKLYFDGAYTRCSIRNILLVGNEDRVRKALDAYHGATPSVKDQPEAYEAAAKNWPEQADMRIAILSENFLKQPVPLPNSKMDTGTIVEPGGFASGSAEITLDETGLRMRAVLDSKEGKSVINLLSQKHEPFAVSRFAADDQAFTFGLRTENQAALADLLMSMTGKFEPSDTKMGKFRLQFAKMMVTSMMRMLGPEFLVYADNNGGLNLVAQIRDREAIDAFLARLHKQDLLNAAKTDLKDLLGDSPAINEMFKPKELNEGMLDSVLSSLPAADRETVRSLVKNYYNTASDPAAPAESASAKPIDFLGNSFHYAATDEFFLLASTQGELDKMNKRVDQHAPSRLDTYLDGPPSGSAFFVTDLAPKIISQLPPETNPALGEIFQSGWRLIGDIIDNGSEVEIKIGLDADLGVLPPRGGGSVAAALPVISWLLITLGLGCGVLFALRVRRVVRAE
ncbi:MAG: hypothetical protein H6683_08125 [Deltaproteobacteria bacterium]|nr:hypothetical protein [Deltaproteobacteria bacterium]